MFQRSVHVSNWIDRSKEGKCHSPAIRDHLSKKQMAGVNTVLSNSYCFNEFQKSGAPGQTRTGDPLLRRYAVQNSKCRFWCRLRGSASFISPLNWPEVGLINVENYRPNCLILGRLRANQGPNRCGPVILNDSEIISWWLDLQDRVQIQMVAGYLRVFERKKSWLRGSDLN